MERKQTAEAADYRGRTASRENLGDVDLIALVLLHDGRELLLDILWVWLCILVGAHKV